MTIGEAADWPVVFSEPMSSISCLERATLGLGQYTRRTSHVGIIDGGLGVGGGHSSTAVWWNCPVGESFLLSFEAKIGGNRGRVCHVVLR